MTFGIEWSKEDSYLKIGFAGSGGTGKTSVCEALKNDLRILEPFRPSIVRETMASLNITTEAAQLNMTEEERWHVQRTIALAKFKQDTDYPYGLFDRTTVDHLAYAMHRCANVIGDNEFLEMVDQAEHHMRNYDLVFFFPIYDWPHATKDGFRQEGLAYRIKIDLLMRAFLADFGIDYIELPNSSVQARVEEINSHVSYARKRAILDGTARWCNVNRDDNYRYKNTHDHDQRNYYLR